MLVDSQPAIRFRSIGRILVRDFHILYHVLHPLRKSCFLPLLGGSRLDGFLLVISGEFNFS